MSTSNNANTELIISNATYTFEYIEKTPVLTFSNDFNDSLKLFYHVMEQASKLILGNYYDMFTILLPNITSVTFGNNYKQPVILTHRTTHIELKTSNYNFEIKLGQNTTHIKSPELYFTKSNFGKEIIKMSDVVRLAHIYFNKKLQFVKFHSYFNKPHVLNKNLINLIYGNDFNHECILNKKLGLLRVGSRFGKPIFLTKNLKNVSFTGNYLGSIHLPKHVGHLYFIHRPKIKTLLPPHIKYFCAGYFIGEDFGAVKHFVFEHPIKILKIYNNCSSADAIFIDNLPNGVEHLELTCTRNKLYICNVPSLTKITWK